MTPPSESPKVTRKARQLRVPVLPTEESDIKRRAAEAGLTVAAYLRNIALGYEIRGVVDHQKVDELLRINADLGRLGGLLKLWLTDDPRTAQFGEATIRALLGRIEATQDVMRGAIDGVLRPRSVSK